MSFENLQYAIYKGKGGNFGAMQFSLQKPHFYNGKQKDFTGEVALDENRKLREGWRQREGCVFLEITSTKEKDVYDWENKITMALSVNDLGKVLMGLMTGNEVKIMHDPGAKTDTAGTVQKYLGITSPNGTKEGCFFSASQINGDIQQHI